MAFSDYSLTPSANVSIAGQNIAPGGPPSAVGPVLRQFAADGKELANLSGNANSFATPQQFNVAGATDSTSKLQALFASGRRVIIIPEANYIISGSIIIPPETKVIAPAGAVFIAGAPNITMFKTTANTFGTQWMGGKFYGNGKSGVNVFDLTAYRHAAEIQDTWMQDINVGIRARNLCWDTAFRHNFMISVVDGFIIDEGSNAVTIDHPAISGFGSTGITILPGSGPLPTVGNNITNGYVQGGPAGILDQGRATSIDGTYFEECSEADISWSGAVMPVLQRSYHSSTGGKVCLKGRGVSGGYADNLVLMGDRTTGIFDFDNSNSYCRARISRTATTNVQLGDTTGLHIIGKLGGTQEPGDIGWDGTRGIYGVLGTGPGSFIERAVANGFEDIATLTNPINALQRSGRFYGVVAGGETITINNMADGQTVTVMLRKSGASTTPVTIAGTAIDMTGATDGKRKTVRATMNAADGNTVWIDESPWK